MSAVKIAKWMTQQFKGNYLYQEDVAWQLHTNLKGQATYTNDNGNIAINKDILREFRKLTDGQVVWERGEKAWRKLSKNEAYTGRLQD